MTEALIEEHTDTRDGRFCFWQLTVRTICDEEVCLSCWCGASVSLHCLSSALGNHDEYWYFINEHNSRTCAMPPLLDAIARHMREQRQPGSVRYLVPRMIPSLEVQP